jgi:hypothetical protein
MPEDAGKKKFVRDFLQNVRVGEGYIEDIWIERAVRTPGSTGEGSTAQSLSGRSIDNITELLEDDLKHSFDDGYFTFRIVSAFKGSGKTSLLTYLHELIKTKPTYKRFSIVSRFPLTSIIAMGGNQDFSVKFYCYILAETFWKLIKNPELSVNSKAKNILSDYLEQAEVNQLVAASSVKTFRPKFIQYFSSISIVFEEFFFDVIDGISQVEPRYTYAYLIDEFDGLEKKPNEFQQALSLIRALIKRAAQDFKSKIRLFIYLVGTSENIKSLFDEDPIIASLVAHQVINLNAGYGNEFEMIKNKIDERIKGAFKGYGNFNNAWNEIRSLSPNPSHTLRGFCQEYAFSILKIYDNYFKEKPEQEFEGNARDLVEAKCKEQWQSYLTQKAYTLSSVSTTTVLKGHAFDCYVELRHNGTCVARCFGEAKNYELLSSHLETFSKWLEDVEFKPSASDGNPPDIAFMIAPSCPSLLKRKLELKNIYFISADKVGDSPPSATIGSSVSNGVNVNLAARDSIVAALKGTGIRGTTIDRLMNLRSNNSFQNVDELASGLRLTPKVKEKLQKKLEDGKICFF